MVSQHELTYEMEPLHGAETTQEVIRPAPKMMPKSKAMPAAPMIPMHTFEEDPWDVMDIRSQTSMGGPQQEIIDALQSRVLTIESALGEILSHVRQSGQAAP